MAVHESQSDISRVEKMMHPKAINKTKWNQCHRRKEMMEDRPEINTVDNKNNETKDWFLESIKLCPNWTKEQKTQINEIRDERGENHHRHPKIH